MCTCTIQAHNHTLIHIREEKMCYNSFIYSPEAVFSGNLNVVSLRSTMPVLVLYPVDVIKYLAKSNLGMKRLILAQNSTLHFIILENQRDGT